MSLENNKILRFANTIVSKCPSLFLKIEIIDNHITLYTTKENFLTVLQFLKKHTSTQYEILIDITAIDYIEPVEKRFELVYQFLSLRFNHRLTLKYFVKSLDMVPSSTFLYKSAGWLEREVWDLFGIFFYSASRS